MEGCQTCALRSTSLRTSHIEKSHVQQSLMRSGMLFVRVLHHLKYFHAGTFPSPSIHPFALRAWESKVHTMQSAPSLSKRQGANSLHHGAISRIMRYCALLADASAFRSLAFREMLLFVTVVLYNHYHFQGFLPEGTDQVRFQKGFGKPH